MFPVSIHNPYTFSTYLVMVCLVKCTPPPPPPSLAPSELWIPPYHRPPCGYELSRTYLLPVYVSSGNSLELTAAFGGHLHTKKELQPAGTTCQSCVSAPVSRPRITFFLSSRGGSSKPHQLKSIRCSRFFFPQQNYTRLDGDGEQTGHSGAGEQSCAQKNNKKQSGIKKFVCEISVRC